MVAVNSFLTGLQEQEGCRQCKELSAGGQKQSAALQRTTDEVENGCRCKVIDKEGRPYPAQAGDFELENSSCLSWARL